MTALPAVNENIRSGNRSACCVSAKLHYTDTGYGHVVQRTSSQQFYNLLYNKFTTNGQKLATSEHLDMSRCWALALRCGKFVVQQVVELLWACPLVVLYNMSVAGVRVVEFGTYRRTAETVLFGRWRCTPRNDEGSIFICCADDSERSPHPTSSITANVHRLPDHHLASGDNSTATDLTAPFRRLPQAAASDDRPTSVRETAP